MDRKWLESDFDRWLEEAGLSLSTRRLYLCALKYYRSYLSLYHNRIAPAGMSRGSHEQYVRSFKDYLVDSHRKANTINAMLTGLKVYYKFVGFGGHRVEPLPEKRSAVPPTLSNEELDRFLWVANRLPARDKALILTSLYAGLTPSEIHNLNQGDITFLGQEVFIRVSKGGRTRRRVVSSGMTLRKILKAYFLELLGSNLASDDSDAPLWRQKNGNRLGVKKIQDIMTEISYVLGFNVSLVKLRNIWLKQQASKTDSSIKKLSRVSGLTREGTIKRYSPKNFAKVASQNE